MSGSEIGFMSGSRDSMSSLRDLHQQLQQSQTPPQQSQNMPLSFTGADDEADPYNPMMSEASPSPQYQSNLAGADSAVNMNMPVKRGSGRPRKYAPVNGETSVALVPACPSLTVSNPSGSRGRFKKMRGRGRPSSSANMDNLQALGSTGVGFTPHILTVLPGEDITAKIMGPNMNGPHSVCVISAFGCISRATLRHPTSSGETFAYEGRFEILSLSGSFVRVEIDGHNNWTGGLSVTLSRLDGGVLGGGVAGPLIAATPIQICFWSLIPEGPDQHVRPMEVYIPTLPTPILPREDQTQALVATSSPQFRSAMSESSDEGEHESHWT